MRDIQNIEADLLKAREECVRLQNELGAAQLAKYLRDAGVPEGCRPVFRDKRTGQRVLVDRHEGIWVSGHVLKKDGSLSNKRRPLFDVRDFEFVGASEAGCA